MHPVERPQEGRLAAAGGADESGHRARLDGHRDVLHRVEVAVVDVEVVDVDALGHEGFFLRRRRVSARSWGRRGWR
ncbi:hypothetical protein [Ornithinimicrobium kibberense]|uniref:hypothetical protein n=1 Tax=Ornithinimicrobium kibberense TaxID=282060 RepID=UPI003622137F